MYEHDQLQFTCLHCLLTMAAKKAPRIHKMVLHKIFCSYTHKRIPREKKKQRKKRKKSLTCCVKIEENKQNNIKQIKNNYIEKWRSVSTMK